MLPSEFWECTLSDIAHFLIAKSKKKEFDEKLSNQKMYVLARMSATMNGTNLRSAFSKKSRNIEYPKYSDFFKDEDVKKKKDSNVYEVINDENKYEFLHKQKLAYEKMGIKFNKQGK
jgi:hypothetical protein